MGPPSSQELAKFSVINNARWAVVLRDPLDNTSTGDVVREVSSHKSYNSPNFSVSE
jgi:hypothetical protein